MKAVFKIILDMINATYYAKMLVFIEATFQEKLLSRHQAVSETDSCLLMRSVGSKP